MIQPSTTQRNPPTLLQTVHTTPAPPKRLLRPPTPRHRSRCPHQPLREAGGGVDPAQRPGRLLLDARDAVHRMEQVVPLLRLFDGRSRGVRRWLVT